MLSTLKRLLGGFMVTPCWRRRRSRLERPARLRATYPGLKTPDAIHAATALDASCARFSPTTLLFVKLLD